MPPCRQCSCTRPGKFGTGSAQLGLGEPPGGAAGCHKPRWQFGTWLGVTRPHWGCLQALSSILLQTRCLTGGIQARGWDVQGPSWPPPDALWDTGTLLAGCRGCRGGAQGARSSGAEAASVPPQLQQEHPSRSPPNVCAEIQQRLRNEEPAGAETRSGARAAGPRAAAAGARGTGRMLQPARYGTGTWHSTRTWHGTRMWHSTAWHSTAHHGTAVPRQKQRCDAKC